MENLESWDEFGVSKHTPRSVCGGAGTAQEATPPQATVGRQKPGRARVSEGGRGREGDDGQGHAAGRGRRRQQQRMARKAGAPQQ